MSHVPSVVARSKDSPYAVLPVLPKDPREDGNPLLGGLSVPGFYTCAGGKLPAAARPVSLRRDCRECDGLDPSGVRFLLVCSVLAAIVAGAALPGPSHPTCRKDKSEVR